MGKKQNTTSVSSVSTEEGSNYAGQQGGFSGGLNENDKQYLNNLLSANQASGKRSAESDQAKNPIIGNYYGSMIGNVPLFAKQGITAPIDNIDAMYQKDQIMKMSLLKKDAITIPEIGRSDFNEVFYNNWKSLIDFKYKQVTAAFNGDSAKATAYMKSDPSTRHLNTQLNKMTEEYDTIIKNMSDIFADPNSDNFIPPSAMKKYRDVLEHPEVVNKSFKRDPKTGEVYDVDLSTTATLLNAVQKFPSMFAATKEITAGYENKIAGDMNPAHFGNSSNDAWVAYNTTNEGFESPMKDENGKVIGPSKLDEMTDVVMKSEYYGLDPQSADYEETRSIVKDTINLRVKRAVEKQYQVLSSKNGEKKLAISSLAMGVGRAQVYNMKAGTFESREVDNYIAHNSADVYENAARIGVRLGQTYESQNYPGALVELLDNNVSFSVADEYNKDVVIDKETVKAVPSWLMGEVMRLTPGAVDFASKMVRGDNLKVRVAEANVILRPYSGGGTTSTKGNLTKEEKDKLGLKGTVTETTTQQSPKSIKIRLHYPDGRTEDVEHNNDLNIMTLAAETSKVTTVNEEGYGYLLEDEYKKGGGKSSRLSTAVSYIKGTKDVTSSSTVETPQGKPKF